MTAEVPTDEKQNLISQLPSSKNELNSEIFKILFVKAIKDYFKVHWKNKRLHILMAMSEPGIGNS
ncbi:hypothetical protein BpHYR1_039748 [Brachionus plicatilis]|uniref:Uncharacterized protein n=1 Tax=Brachionus plicatilis TaxID=10195 RepID=A0A3M7T5Z8_BRAPC|nr:hypothetical protein BpHYR1_039748 [Brachionus plicatilis]